MPSPPSDADSSIASLRRLHEERLAAMRSAYAEDGDGWKAAHARATAVDELLAGLWENETRANATLMAGVVLAALGGYGRGQLFPCSDVDILFCTEKAPGPPLLDAIRRVSQTAWDSGLRLSASTRALGECGRQGDQDPEGGLALLDLRQVGGDPALYQALRKRVQERPSARDRRTLAAAAARLTAQRHARFGETLFHLEPNIKDAPGGLRDTHVVHWLAALRGDPSSAAPGTSAFREASAFLASLRVFLHLRHGRDDNTLDWNAQDVAAAQMTGMLPGADMPLAEPPDAAYWMRLYFRHARVVARALEHELELSGLTPAPSRLALRSRAPAGAGFSAEAGTLCLSAPGAAGDPALDPEAVLHAFGFMAETGLRLHPDSEQRLAAAIPALSSALEDGARLWVWLRRILCGRHAAAALRTMHALGLLDLIIPEFHGIDALVIRDAYHRYTVDEHTFVLLEKLHALADAPAPSGPPWRLRFGTLLRDLPYPELLMLAALLHDTGKARFTNDHAEASARLAAGVTCRLDLDEFNRELVMRLIRSHLDMSTTLRRDIFDAETVRVFAESVGSHDQLRMLTLLTYADISAVHPDALTPWKAENLWRLWMAAENQLDRSIDRDRIHTGAPGAAAQAASIARVLNLPPASRQQLERYLEGAPERYLRTRSPETIRQHMEIASGANRAEVLLAETGASYEVTILTTDRPHLFADVTGALAGWGMNILSAEAFANAAGVVVDTFRFTDPYRTLELNPGERDRLRASLGSVILGAIPIDTLLKTRRRSARGQTRRVVETRVEFDNMSSGSSTLMQMVAQDEPGLLHRASMLLSDFGCSVEVALIDTEGEMAIDVFYLTLNGEKLGEIEQMKLQQVLLAGI